MKMKPTKSDLKRKARLVGAGLLVSSICLWSGCGGNGEEDDGTPSSSQNQNNNPPSQSGQSLAPSTVGGKTLQGHIGGTSINFQLILTGSGQGGNYLHTENGMTLERGTFTYTKQSATQGVLLIAPNGGAVTSTIQLTFTARNQGNYFITESGEDGTFSLN